MKEREGEREKEYYVLAIRLPTWLTYREGRLCITYLGTVGKKDKINREQKPMPTWSLSKSLENYEIRKIVAIS